VSSTIYWKKKNKRKIKLKGRQCGERMVTEEDYYVDPFMEKQKKKRAIKKGNK
jgi:hypothetical protein